MGSAEKGSGKEGELRRIGLSSLKTSGLDQRTDDVGGKWRTFWMDDTHRHLYARGAVREV